MKNCSWTEWRTWARRLFQDPCLRSRRTRSSVVIENLESRTVLSVTSIVATDPAAADPEVPEELEMPLGEESESTLWKAEESSANDENADATADSSNSFDDITDLQRTLTSENEEDLTQNSEISEEVDGFDESVESTDDGWLDESENSYDVILYTMGGPDDPQAENRAPTVSNDSAITDEDVEFHGSVSPLGLDADGDPLTYVVIAQPLHGTVVLSPDGTFVYKPGLNFNGNDSFTFIASDGTLASPTALFQVATTPVDDPFELKLTTSPTDILPNYVQSRIDGTATVGDVDTPLSYSGATIAARIISGGSSRDVLSIRNQGTGLGLVKIKKQALYYNGSSQSIGRFAGGFGKPLTITFNANATEAAVNAVLKQVGFKTSKKGGTGVRTIQFEVKLGNTTALGTAAVNVVS